MMHHYQGTYVAFARTTTLWTGTQDVHHLLAGFVILIRLSSFYAQICFRSVLQFLQLLVNGCIFLASCSIAELRNSAEFVNLVDADAVIINN